MKIRIKVLSDADLVPPQLLTYHNGPGSDHQHHHHSPPSNRQLALPPKAVAATSGSYSRFKVPDDGWIVQEVPRRDGTCIDKYYYEAETGMKFRSSKEVERYIKGREYHDGRGDHHHHHSPSNQQLAALPPAETGGYSRFKVPDDGWIVEEVPRRDGSRMDKYYYEAGTGMKFRSSNEVERYIKGREYNNGRCDHHHHHHSPSNRQLAALPPVETGGYSRFKVPDDGWIVEEAPRRDGSRMDKYYYEAGTGMKFRSSKEVERYIKGGEYPSSCLQHRRYSKCIKRGGKVVRLDEEEFNRKQLCTNARLSITDLPDGWIVEDIPRRLGGSDRYYYEPGTGRRFRSLVAVVRHLEEEIPLSAYIEEMNESAPLSKALKLRHKGKDDVSRKRNSTTSSNGDGQTSSSFVSPPPPKKTKWVLGSSEGDVWYPFMRGILVPDSVKQQWNQSLMAVMKDDDGN